MNKKRREDLRDAACLLNKAIDIVDGVLAEERFAMMSVPYNLQYSSRYQESEDAVDSLYEAVSGMKDASYSINEAIGI